MGHWRPATITTSPEVAHPLTVTQSLRAGDLDEVARRVAELQRDPEQYVCYLSTEPAAIAAELGELPGGPAATVVAVSGGRPVGLLAADHDTDPPRVWWHGPFVWGGEGWRGVADRLYASARRRLPPQVTQEELGPDDRSVRIAAFARAHGFAADAAAAVLVLAAPFPDPHPGTVVPTTVADHAELARLHDDLFPGSASTGAELVDPDDPDRVALAVRRAGGLAGYVVVERQADGGGYIDLVGVRPDLRGRGLGRALVLAGVGWLHERGCAPVSLTVREDLRAPRALYESVGFVEERTIRPWRKGFSLHRA